ncbi:MAG: 3-isopropylmalate dehydratase small subunit [Candidatus Geothermarchaeales archaeon]
MRETIVGKAWKVGDNVDTDQIYPGRYLPLTDVEEMAKHAMEGLEGLETFAEDVSPGDVLVAGRNFGCGSSREHAALALKNCGVTVVAESFARIFYRNAVNIGLPILEVPGISEAVEQGHKLQVDFKEGGVRNLTTGEEVVSEPLPGLEAEILGAGGLLNYLKGKKPT